MTESEIISDCLNRGWTVTLDSTFAVVTVHNPNGIGRSVEYREWNEHPNALRLAYDRVCKEERR